MSTAELSARFLLAFVLSLIAGSLTVWAFQAVRASDWLARIQVSAKDFRYRLAYVRFAVREAFPARRDGVGLRYSPRFGHVPPLCRVDFHRQLIAGIERVRYQLAELESLIGEHQIDVVTGKTDMECQTHV